MNASDLFERFDHLRTSGVCSPTTRALLDDSEQIIRELLVGRTLRIEAVRERDELAGRVAAGLGVIDRSMYGDPEVPFRMRAALTGGAS